MLVNKEVINRLLTERNSEARKATLHPNTIEAYRVVEGSCWLHQETSSEDVRGYFFCTKENSIVDTQNWQYCVLEIVDTGEINEVRIEESAAVGWYYLSHQRKIVNG